MLDPINRPYWPDLIGPLDEASMALGRLQQTLQSNPLYPAWLWRETARMAAKIGQAAGYRLTYDQLVHDLASLSFGRVEDHGVAAGRRIFLIAARLFRAPGTADLIPAPTELFEPIWGGEPPRADSDGNLPGAASTSDDDNHCDGDRPGGPPAAGRGEGSALDDEDDLVALRNLIRAMVTASHEEVAPLIGLLRAVRSRRIRELLPTLARLALPLALHQAGLVPKVAPALLGGRLPPAANAWPAANGQPRAVDARPADPFPASEPLATAI